MHIHHASILLGLAAYISANPLLVARGTCTTDAGSGTCRNTASGCSGGTFYKNHCPGAANIQCCVVSSHVGDACTAGSVGAGTCASTSNGCSGGTFHKGFCGGPSTTQCCVKKPAESSHVGDSCTADAGAGTCGDTSTACSGGTYYPGVCGGPSTVQCCVKGSSDPPTAPTPPSGTGEKYPINEASIKLLEANEGFSSTFYTINGHKTIGYGHDCVTGPGGCSGISEPLSRAEGEKLFRKDLPNYEGCICEHAGGSGLNANQYGALVSFAYNSGCGGMAKYFGSKLSAKDYSGICSALPTTNTLGGQLSSRRQKEADLCSTATNEKSACAA